MSAPTERFTDRARDYAAHRPGYPAEALEIIRGLCAPPAVAADVGAGTGIFSRLLAALGYSVQAVEPNAAMRAQGEAHTERERVTFVDGSGESTGLDSASVDLITVAQAFHWLDHEKARAEFLRIGKPGCPIAIIWNSRLNLDDAFMREYNEQLLQLAPDYKSVRMNQWQRMDSDVEKFFGAKPNRYQFPNPLTLNAESFKGLHLSSSFVPKEGHSNYEPMMEAVRSLFERFQAGGHVQFHYETILYTGIISA